MILVASLMTIATPVKGFSGVVAGVTFTNGVAKSDDPVALAYFVRHGYQVRRPPGRKKAA